MEDSIRKFYPNQKNDIIEVGKGEKNHNDFEIKNTEVKIDGRNSFNF